MLLQMHPRWQPPPEPGTVPGAVPGLLPGAMPVTAGLAARGAHRIAATLVVLGELTYVVAACLVDDPVHYATPLLLLFPSFLAAWFLQRRGLLATLAATTAACFVALTESHLGSPGLILQLPLTAGVLNAAALGLYLLRRRVERLLAATRALSTLDPLTGLANRRSLVEQAPRLWRQARRDGTQVAAMVLDLDHFKQLNDAYGHAAGDAVLCAVARSLAGAVRPADVLARTGGEELVVLSTVADAREATRLASDCGPPSAGRTPTRGTGSPPRSGSRSPGRSTARTPSRRCGGWSTGPTRRCTRPSGRAGTGSSRRPPSPGPASHPNCRRRQPVLAAAPPPDPPDPPAPLGAVTLVVVCFADGMTLVAPDPTRTVPLSLREQADVRDRWLTQRLLDVLPGLMDETAIDLWLVVGREYNEDPVLPTLLPATWLSARRRTILALHRSDDGVTACAVSRYPVGLFEPAWTPEERPDLDPDESQWATVRRIVEQAEPRRIGIDVSATFALADGLSHTEYLQLTDALGPHAERLVPAEDLAIRWLETRLPEEIEALHALNRLAHQVIAEAYSPAAITVGTTTALDLAWWIRQRFADLGVDGWFQPTVSLQRAGVPLTDVRGTILPAVPFDAVIEPGDLVHCDVGLSSLGLHTDTQRNGYVLRPGEDEAPAGLRAAVAAGNRMQDLTTAALMPGRTGNGVLAAARSAAAAEGLDGDVYSHPVGYHGHAAGPTIGLWDQQDGVPGAGDRLLYADTVYALELCVRVPVPEWGGQTVRMALEEGVGLTDGGVDYLDGRQTDVILIPPS